MGFFRQGSSVPEQIQARPEKSLLKHGALFSSNFGLRHVCKQPVRPVHIAVESLPGSQEAWEDIASIVLKSMPFGPCLHHFACSSMTKIVERSLLAFLCCLKNFTSFSF